jgi:hypothetical protein
MNAKWIEKLFIATREKSVSAHETCECVKNVLLPAPEAHSSVRRGKGSRVPVINGRSLGLDKSGMKPEDVNRTTEINKYRMNYYARSHRGKIATRGALEKWPTCGVEGRDCRSQVRRS